MDAIAVVPIQTSSAGGDDGLALFIVLLLGGPFLLCLALLVLAPLYRWWQGARRVSKPNQGNPS